MNKGLRTSSHLCAVVQKKGLVATAHMLLNAQTNEFKDRSTSAKANTKSNYTETTSTCILIKIRLILED